MKRLTVKQVEEKYFGKAIGADGEPVAVGKFNDPITKTISFKFNNGKFYTVLLSDYPCDGIPYGVYVEAIIDRHSGKNAIPGRSRPADSKRDAVDVAWEMLYEEDL